MRNEFNTLFINVKDEVSGAIRVMCTLITAAVARYFKRIWATNLNTDNDECLNNVLYQSRSHYRSHNEYMS